MDTRGMNEAERLEEGLTIACGTDSRPRPPQPSKPGVSGGRRDVPSASAGDGAGGDHGEACVVLRRGGAEKKVAAFAGGGGMRVLVLNNEYDQKQTSITYLDLHLILVSWPWIQSGGQHRAVLLSSYLL